MTASADLIATEAVRVRYGDRILVLEMDEAVALCDDLCRILGRDKADTDALLVEMSKACDALSAKAMGMLRRVRG